MITGIVAYAKDAIKKHPYLFGSWLLGNVLYIAYSMYDNYKRYSALQLDYNINPNLEPNYNPNPQPIFDPQNKPFSPFMVLQYWGTDRVIEQYDNKEWRVVNFTIDWVSNCNKQWVSLGAVEGREKLFLDENDEFMVKIKKDVLEASRGKSVSDVLKIVNEQIKHLTNSANGELFQQYEKEFKEKHHNITNEANPPIIINEFIENRISVCRHKALIACPLLAHLVDNQCLPTGEVRMYRSFIFEEDGNLRGTHAWTIYQEKVSEDLWLVDPEWETELNLSNKVWLDFAYKYYGISVINDMKTRLRQIAAENTNVNELTEQIGRLNIT